MENPTEFMKRPKFLFWLAVLPFILSSCGTDALNKRINEDYEFRAAAERLTEDYMNGQMRGENGRSFGVPTRFHNLIEFRITGMGVEFFRPAVFVTLKAGNRMGGVMWKDYCALLRHDPAEEQRGDQYYGLRLTAVKPTMEQILSDN